jgi:hypothetical protein
MIRWWGRSIPEDAVCGWGARAIWQGSRPYVDLLPDRQAWSVEQPNMTDAERTAAIVKMTPLKNWLDTTGLKWLHKAAAEDFVGSTSENRTISFDDGVFHIEANPQGSCGYLYIAAWQRAEGWTAATSPRPGRSKKTEYRGMRCAPEEKTVSDSLVYVDDKPLDPAPSQKIHNHSPDGFNWGYGGSGPAQLALGLLLDYYGKESPVWKHYQTFKFGVIAKLPQQGDWVLRGEDIETVMTQVMREKGVA